MPKTQNLADAINAIGDEVESVLKRKKRDRYLEAIILLYSLIENVLKWAVFMKITWDKTQRQPEHPFPRSEVDRLRKFCKRLSFRDALNVALSVNQIDFKLYRKIDKVREERNDVVHQLWLYIHRRNSRVLGSRLKKLIAIARQLVKTVSNLVDEIGLDEILEVQL
jgi:hypothetical protein